MTGWKINLTSEKTKQEDDDDDDNDDNDHDEEEEGEERNFEGTFPNQSRTESEIESSSPRSRTSLPLLLRLLLIKPVSAFFPSARHSRSLARFHLQKCASLILFSIFAASLVSFLFGALLCFLAASRVGCFL